MIKTSKSYNDKVLTITLSRNDVNSIKISMLKDLYNVLHDINLTTTRFVILILTENIFVLVLILKKGPHSMKMKLLNF